MSTQDWICPYCEECCEIPHQTIVLHNCSIYSHAECCLHYDVSVSMDGRFRIKVIQGKAMCIGSLVYTSPNGFQKFCDCGKQ